MTRPESTGVQTELSEEAIYEQSVKETFKQVFTRHLARLPGTKRDNDFYERNLAIYYDATMRGYPVFSNRLVDQGFTLTARAAVKKYSVIDDQITWKIQPKSEGAGDDPFVLAQFIRDYQNQGIPTQGSTDFWTDPFLVEQALLEGLKIQKKYYDEFNSALAKIDNTEIGMVSIYSNLSSPRPLFESFKGAANGITRFARSRKIDKSEAFASLYLVKSDPIIDQIPRVSEVCQDIHNLRGLFRGQDGLPVESIDKGVYENSFVVKLLTTDSPINPESLSRSIVTPEQVRRAMQLLTNAKSGTAKAESDRLIYLIAYQTLQDHQADIRALLNNLSPGLNDSDLGMEYLARLVYRRLKKFPGSDYVIAGDEDLQMWIRDPRLNHHFLLSEPITRPSGSSAAAESPDRISDQDIGHFVANFTIERKFNTATFSRWSPDVQRRVLSTIVNHQSLSESSVYQSIISELMRVLGVSYSPEDKVFKTAGGFSEPARMLLEIYLSKIREGDELMVNTLEKRILLATFHDVIRPFQLKGFVVSRSIGADYGRVLEGMIARWRDSKEGGEEIVSDMLNLLAAEALEVILKSPQGAIGINTVKDQLLARIDRYNVSAQIENMSADRKQRLSVLYQTVNSFNLVGKSREFLNKLKTEFVLRGQEGLSSDQALVSLIEDSLAQPAN